MQSPRGLSAGVTGTEIGQELQDTALAELQSQLIQPFLDIINDTSVAVTHGRGGCNVPAKMTVGFPLVPGRHVRDHHRRCDRPLRLGTGRVSRSYQDRRTTRTVPFSTPNAAIGALGDAAAVIANIGEVIDSFSIWTDTEGITSVPGLSSTRSPYVCWFRGSRCLRSAGRLGNNQVSIGSRYTSHNLSQQHALSSGLGFAVQARGYVQSRAAIEPSQIDG